jgi:WD40 repeat protein
LISGGGDDRTARAWDVDTGRPRAVFQAHTQEVNCLSLSADGRVLATGSSDQSIMVWDVPPAK